MAVSTLACRAITSLTIVALFPVPHSIEDDFLNLMDEVDIDEFLKEAAMAIDDAEKLSEFIREKATIAIERFLVSLKLRI